jgi:hypothetical protein
MNSKFNPFILVTRKTRPRKIERRERERERERERVFFV